MTQHDRQFTHNSLLLSRSPAGLILMVRRTAGSRTDPEKMKSAEHTHVPEFIRQSYVQNLIHVTVLFIYRLNAV